MQPQLELSAALTAACCSTLQYLEGAAYIAVVLAVVGVPQLLTYTLIGETAAATAERMGLKQSACVGKSRRKRNTGTTRQ